MICDFFADGCFKVLYGYLCRAISTSAANAIELDNSLSVIKVALATPSPSRVSSASVAELRFATVLFEAGGATTA